MRSANNVRHDSVEKPWYSESWYMEDLESALESARIAVTEENLEKLLQGCRNIFDDKTIRVISCRTITLIFTE